MKNIFESKSIAIIGASNKKKKVGFQVTANLIKQGFNGRIYPVNFDDKEVQGLKAYSSVLEIHAPIDLAVIIIPRDGVITVIKQCLLKNIPNFLIITAGFAEKDAAGKKIQTELTKLTASIKGQLIGPNCLGIIDTASNMNLTFAANEIRSGGLGLILQSGAIGTAIFDWADKNNIGISKFISLGNKIKFSEVDALEMLAADPLTKYIALYLEEFTYPEKFLYLAQEITKRKPIIILKGGLSDKGAKAASSHTAALSSDSKINAALIDQANLISADNFSELLGLISLFNKKNIDIEKNSLAIITNAGGPGILAADSADKFGFRLPGLNSLEQLSLSRKLETYASLSNPFDLGGDARSSSYEKAFGEIIKSDRYAVILSIITPQSMTEIIKTAEKIVNFENEKMPIFAVLMGGTKISPAAELLKKKQIPVYDDPALAIGTIAKIYRYHKKNHDKEIIEFKLVNYQSRLSEKEIIANYSIPFATYHEVQNDGELMGKLEKLNFPLCYKSSKVLHRGKSGRVGLNIWSHEDLKKAVKMIGFPGIVQEMVDSPFEIFIGAKRDPNFGPVVLFGQGGIFTEEFEDISIKMYPLTESDLQEMIKSTKVYQQIKELKVEELVKKTIKQVLRIILENPNIKEIEFNPIKVLPKKLIAVDINLKYND